MCWIRAADKRSCCVDGFPGQVWLGIEDCPKQKDTGVTKVCINESLNPAGLYGTPPVKLPAGILLQSDSISTTLYDIETFRCEEDTMQHNGTKLAGSYTSDTLSLQPILLYRVPLREVDQSPSTALEQQAVRWPHRQRLP